MKEEKSIGNLIINFVLAFFLFLVEIILVLQINLSRGIKQEEVIELIDNIDIQTEIKKLDSYKKIKADENTLNKIFNSQEMNIYIKENIKAIYKNICYNEHLNYIEDSKIEEFVNEQIKEIEQETIGIEEQNIETNESNINEPIEEPQENIITIENNIEEPQENIITIENNIEEQNILSEQTKNEIKKTVKEITNKINKKTKEIEDFTKDINVIKIAFEQKTTLYILIAVLAISLIIVSINDEKAKFFWIGIPTIVTGVLYLIIYLTITGKINATGIDLKIQDIIIKLPNLLDKIKKTSIITTIIGFAFCTLYTILNYQEMGIEQDGKI